MGSGPSLDSPNGDAVSEYTDSVLAFVLDYLKTHPEVRPYLSDAWYLGYVHGGATDELGGDWRHDPFAEPPNGTYRPEAGSG